MGGLAHGDETAIGARRCTARNRQGDRCGNAAIRGAAVCKMHGAGAPQVRRKAALRLAELVDPAIGTLAREMMKAEKSADRQRAANSLLDRAGITGAGISSDADASRAILLGRLLSIRAEADGEGLAADLTADDVREARESGEITPEDDERLAAVLYADQPPEPTGEGHDQDQDDQEDDDDDDDRA